MDLIRTAVASRLLPLLAVVLCALLAVTEAQAREPRIAVKITGPQADQVTELVRELVPAGVEVLDDAEFTSALARSGLPGGKMGYALTNPRQRPILLKIVRRAVAAEGLDGALLGRTRGARGGLAVVLVYQRAEGDPELDTTVTLPRGREDQKGELSSELSGVFGPLAPSEPEPEPDEPSEWDEPTDDPDEDEDEDDDDKKPFKPNRPGSELFSLHLGLEIGGRFFTYSDSPANTENARSYEVFGTPGIHLGGAVFPAAPARLTFISDLGLDVSYMRAFGVSSETADQTFQFASIYERFWGGLLYRFRFGEDEDDDDLPVVLNLSLRVGYLGFSFDAEDETAKQIKSEVATVEYVLMRPGVDARLPIGEYFAVMPSFGYVAPLDGGEVYERFRSPSLGGIDMALAFAVVPGAGFEVRAGAEYTRFFSSFEPVPGDPYVAGGALDQFVALRLGAAYVH